MPYFQLPVQIPVHEIGVMTVASPNLEVSSNRNPSPIKSPRVTISPDLEPRFSKSKTTPTKLNAKAALSDQTNQFRKDKINPFKPSELEACLFAIPFWPAIQALYSCGLQEAVHSYKARADNKIKHYR